MSIYSHYQNGNFIEQLNAPKLVIDFNRLNLTTNQTIVDSRLRNKGGNKFGDLFVTSGLLTCKINGNIHVAHTDTYNFRMLIDHYSQQYSPQKNVKFAWQNSSIVCNARINKIIPGNTKSDKNVPDWAGFHLFGRYQTENDLYVASVRMDGNVAIKKKKNGEYTTLGMKTVKVCDVGNIFQMQFEIVNNQKGGVSLYLWVDRNQVLCTEDNLNVISNGTNGIRIDYCDTDIFSISIK